MVSVPKKRHLPNSPSSHTLGLKTHLYTTRQTQMPRRVLRFRSGTNVQCGNACQSELNEKTNKPSCQAASWASHPGNGMTMIMKMRHILEILQRKCLKFEKLSTFIGLLEHLGWARSYQKLQSCRVWGSTQSNSTKASTTLSAQIWLARNFSKLMVNSW